MSGEDGGTFDGIIVNALGALIATGIVTVLGIGGSGDFSLIKIIGAAVIIFLTSIATQSTTELAKAERVALIVTSFYVLGVLALAWLASENAVFQDRISLILYLFFVIAGLWLSARMFEKVYQKMQQAN